MALRPSDLESADARFLVEVSELELLIDLTLINVRNDFQDGKITLATVRYHTSRVRDEIVRRYTAAGWSSVEWAPFRVIFTK